MVPHLHGAPQSPGGAITRSKAAAIEFGALPRKVAVAELRATHPHVGPDASCEVLEGWRGILDASLGSMADLKVRVTDIRVKVGALTMAVLPSEGTWRGGDATLVASCLRQAVERSLRTCEACGRGGSLRGGPGPSRIRCVAHADVP